MSGRRKNDRRRRSRSPCQTRDEDADFQFALKLSAELNGDLGGHAEAAAAAAKRQAQYDDDDDDDNFDFAVQMQFSNEGYLPDASTSSLAAPQEGATDNTKPTIVETEASVGQTLKPLSDFQDYLKASECAKCGDRFLKCESDVGKLFEEWYECKDELSSLLRCKTCGLSSCIACPSTTFSRRSLAIFNHKSASWCCDDGRLLLIWILLCGFDVSYCETKARSAKEAEAAKKKSEPTPVDESKGKGKAKVGQSAQNSGVGYGGNDGYFGYMPSMGLEELDVEDFDAVTDGAYSQLLNQMMKKSRFGGTGPGRSISDQKSQAFEAQQAMDRLATTVLSLLQYLLPSLERGHSFDIGPPAMIADMLLESRILDYCADLLRNDSLDDTFSRKATYDAALNFVKVIGMHHTTARSTVFSKRPQQPELCNLLTQTYRRIEPPSRGTAPSIADSLRELSKLSDLLLKNAGHHKTIYSAGSDQKLLSLCRKVSELWKLFSLSAHMHTPDSEASNTTTPSTLTEVAPVSDVPDEQVFVPHAFAVEARAQFRSAPGRFKRLVSEINVLQNSLPPDIFVRHGESRLDLMKCTIIGPGGTPYENGVFEFDIYCPVEYPKIPPLVSFKGSDGVHGINPNLYADGKVCLSLLGTWPGEPWKPGESTLLQVLVSLQAMVFCEQPWYNEPGRECNYGSVHANKAS